MLKKLAIGGAILLLLVTALVIFVIFNYGNIERGYQKSADLTRIRDLIYWTGLIEEYETKTGHYPFQDKLVNTDEIGFARIVSEYQQRYFDPESSKYIPQFDNNWNNRFSEWPTESLISELELGLNREIETRYDFQKVPSGSTIGYNYFITEDGYILWVTCISCGVTRISTLLMDGHTPTVNIGSKGMVPNVTKAFTREDMLANPQFQEWLNGNFDTQ